MFADTAFKAAIDVAAPGNARWVTEARERFEYLTLGDFEDAGHYA
jgi:hypothetical protein